mmetsp:Transcript_53817/g.64952  ORF Transcript_53817/g.64952 Transcript_53817/m.64952 type:complete len:118 (-) Transcript_53817:148-501(-)|eukprot:CAMPEP_0172510988 /NCGR_PEP_ID=MMETSP1066-20121228/232828_1 /TAXON_ID=671091 /ORGANISM="Coscinodiscus wailesii, Strain CCMP2513" /LENGTH=117 /DNA_ID=CAMNT_0013290173 /DNA_START=140 /DNA_END=493 /DNA_ORIENTATION=-
MAEQQQEDGYYPRLNGQMLQNPRHMGGIISLVGTILQNDGTALSVRCADGQMARVTIEPDFVGNVGTTVEIVGVHNDDGTVTLFVARDMGNDFDMATYNQMIAKVQNNPKYAELFTP